MSFPSITRKNFIDRHLTYAELAHFAEMVRHWYLLNAQDLAPAATVRCNATAYAIPRHERDTIKIDLAPRCPTATFDETDPDELRILGSQQSALLEADTTPWSAPLDAPTLQHACLLLTITVEGPLHRSLRASARGKTTFVLCGLPDRDGFLLKALWRVGADESLQLVYQRVAWECEKNALHAFDLFLRLAPKSGHTAAATAALAAFGNPAKKLFLTQMEERWGLRLSRQLAEMPDDRGPAAFLRRIALSLLAALCPLLLLPFSHSSTEKITLIVLIILGLLWTAWLLFTKAKAVTLYYRAMRASFNKLYSQQVTYEAFDLSSDHTPTIIKLSRELEALGARHLGDYRHISARGPSDGSRSYILGDATINLDFLQKAETLSFFPPKPVIAINTRFTDGRHHSTTNRPRSRKSHRPGWTSRSVLDHLGVQQMLASHTRYVARLKAEGAIPMPPSRSLEELLEKLRQQFEESKSLWHQSPYSWSDALHHAFKITRHEYRDD